VDDRISIPANGNNLLFFIMCRPVLGHTEPLIFATGGCIPGGIAAGAETNFIFYTNLINQKI
jgi:hypothetical protein